MFEITSKSAKLFRPFQHAPITSCRQVTWLLHVCAWISAGQSSGPSRIVSLCDWSRNLRITIISSCITPFQDTIVIYCDMHLKHVCVKHVSQIRSKYSWLFNLNLSWSSQLEFSNTLPLLIRSFPLCRASFSRFVSHDASRCVSVLRRGLLVLGCEELCRGTESIGQGLGHSQAETNLIRSQNLNSWNSGEYLK